MVAKKLLKNLFLQSLEECSPQQAIKSTLSVTDDIICVKGLEYAIAHRPIYVFAVGKAAVQMFEQTKKILQHHITGSLVIASDKKHVSYCTADEVLVTNHPTPGSKSAKAGKKAMEFMQGIPAKALVINLISGGTSSLLCTPADGISIVDLSTTYELLNNSGAVIHDINIVRKHCSKIKGGQLLNDIHPQCLVVDLVISDVPNDDLSVVGSGPTISDQSSYQDAYHILLQHDLWEKVPQTVRNHIEKGIRGEVLGTVDPQNDPIENHRSMVISSASMLAKKVAELAKEKSLDVTVADTPFNDDVQKVASSITNLVLSKQDNVNPKRSHLYIFWGESTVQVTGSGKGGRNQELALWAALKLDGHKNITWLSAGTDGVDGPTDAAGAIVDGTTIAKARDMDIDPERYLSENDSYHFHKKMDTHLETGATGNNLMDVVMVFVE